MALTRLQEEDTVISGDEVQALQRAQEILAQLIDMGSTAASLKAELDGIIDYVTPSLSSEPFDKFG
jgi:hypothetical protein